MQTFVVKAVGNVFFWPTAPVSLVQNTVVVGYNFTGSAFDMVELVNVNSN
jgi:hypothetical protein